jgi:hypothetical protein
MSKQKKVVYREFGNGEPELSEIAVEPRPAATTAKPEGTGFAQGS